MAFFSEPQGYRIYSSKRSFSSSSSQKGAVLKRRTIFNMTCLYGDDSFILQLHLFIFVVVGYWVSYIKCVKVGIRGEGAWFMVVGKKSIPGLCENIVNPLVSEGIKGLSYVSIIKERNKVVTK